MRSETSRTPAISAFGSPPKSGILRDIVRADKENPALERTFYSEVALIRGFAFALFLTTFDGAAGSGLITVAIVATMIGAFTTRLLAVHRDWKSPSYTARRPSASTPLPAPPDPRSALVPTTGTFRVDPAA